MKTGLSLATQYGITPADDIYTVETSGRTAFAGGIFVYFPITESVGIQQELLYAMKGSGQDVTITTPFNILVFMAVQALRYLSCLTGNIILPVQLIQVILL